jgi:hypothetical protein
MVTTEKINEVLRDAIRAKAQENATSVERVQLVIGTNDDAQATPVYKLAHDFEVKREIAFKEVYDGFMSSIVAKKAAAIMSGALKKVSNALKIRPSKIRIVVWTQGEEETYYTVYATSEQGEEIRRNVSLEKLLE